MATIDNLSVAGDLAVLMGIGDDKLIVRDSDAANARGDMVSVQAVYVPADDYADPAIPFWHMDSDLVLSREIAAEGIYPAVDPLASSSKALDSVIGDATARVKWWFWSTALALALVALLCIVAVFVVPSSLHSSPKVAQGTGAGATPAAKPPLAAPKQMTGNPFIPPRDDIIPL